MDICVLIMSTETEPSISNIKAMKETFIKDVKKYNLKHNYTFVEYVCHKDDSKPVGDIICEKEEDADNYYKLKINEVETIYRTFEKTVYAMRYILSHNICNFDFLVRINISNFLNIRSLDVCIDFFDPNLIYCNRCNTVIDINFKYTNMLYPRGDMMIFGKDVLKRVLEVSDMFMYCDTRFNDRVLVDHVDDVIFGLCISEAFGAETKDILKCLKYNFIPSEHVDVGAFDGKCISNRVKTLPPDVICSGYSWEYNKYRNFDSKKMYDIEKLLDESDFDYFTLNASDIILDDSVVKDVILLNVLNISLEDYKTKVKFK